MSRSHGHPSHQRHDGQEFGTIVQGNIGKADPVARNTNVSPGFSGELFLLILKIFRPQDAARSLVQIVQKAKSGSVWVMEGQDVYEMETPERWELRKKDE